jgi:hypothetical protein
VDTSRFTLQDKTILANWCEMAEVAEQDATAARKAGARIDSPAVENGGSLNILKPGATTATVTFIETLGKGGAAVVIGACLLAVLLSGMAWQKASSERDRALSSDNAAIARLNEERIRHQQAEAELRSRFEETLTESRMAEYYILELDGKLMAGGFIPPSRGYGQWKQEHKK